jgi:hypothetical protein
VLVGLTSILQAENIVALENKTKEKIKGLEAVITAGEKTSVLPTSFADDLRQMTEAFLKVEAECFPWAISRIVTNTQSDPLISMRVSQGLLDIIILSSDTDCGMQVGPGCIYTKDFTMDHATKQITGMKLFMMMQAVANNINPIFDEQYGIF